MERSFRHLGNTPSVLVFLAVVNKPVDNSYSSFQQNLRIAKNVVDACYNSCITSVIYFSSVDVYGAQPELPLTEDSKIDPDTWYGLAKYSCEWTLRNDLKSHCPVTVLRIPGIYGSGPKDRSVIGRMISSIRRENKIYLSGRGEMMRDYVFVDDICRLVKLLVPKEEGDLVNVATGVSMRLLEIAQRIYKVIGQPCDFVFEPRNQLRSFDLAFDNAKLNKMVPQFSFSPIDVGIKSYLQE